MEYHAKVFAVFGSSMLEKLTPGVKLTVTCHENAGSYMFTKKLTVTCHVLTKIAQAACRTVTCQIFSKQPSYIDSSREQTE